MLPQALKLKVIQQYEAGKLQKDIAHDLGISTGSVSTILHPKDKQKYEDNSNSNLSLNNLQEQQLIASEESKPAINIGTPTSICNDSPSSNAGDGLKPEPDLKTSGGPLKFFLNPTAVAAVVAILMKARMLGIQLQL